MCACISRPVPLGRSGCRSACSRERGAGEHLPDGVAIVEDRGVVVEVELTVKSKQRVTAILDELAARFDTVLYFCAPGPHRQLTELAQSGRWPTLGVRELPNAEGGGDGRGRLP
jgi:hypothetical protein